MLLRSTSVKAARKMSVKLTPGVVLKDASSLKTSQVSKSTILNVCQKRIKKQI